MMFENRQEAGRELAMLLNHYKNQPDTLILALPRGGVVVANEVAKLLHLPMDVIIARKVGAPFNPELALGAVTEIGEGYFNEDLMEQIGISKGYLHNTIEKEVQEAKRRLKAYRRGRPPLVLKGKTVILVDDGIATGATMKASIRSAKALGAKKIVVAVPVSSAETHLEIAQEVNEVVTLSSPEYFYAVGQFYNDFSQTTDEEVIAILTPPPSKE
jgi:putative phosphoribosyl transferase